MKSKLLKVKVYVSLLLSISVVWSYAQNTLYVNNKSGTKTQFTLSGIKTLTFESGNINLHNKDGSVLTYALTNILYLSFGNTTVLDEISRDNICKTTLYPNPARETIQVQFTSTKASILLKIIDMQGRVIYQQCISCQSGLNNIDISVSDLKSGLYFCQLQNVNSIKTLKFIKY